jgi:hypothetical protein
LVGLRNITFQKTIIEPKVRNENDLQKCKTNVYKNVEHTFDVLHAQWGVMHYPTQLWNETIMKFV